MIGGGRLHSNAGLSGLHFLVDRLYDRDARHVRLDGYALKPICLQGTRKPSQPFSSALLTPDSMLSLPLSNDKKGEIKKISQFFQMKKKYKKCRVKVETLQKKETC